MERAVNRRRCSSLCLGTLCALLLGACATLAPAPDGARSLVILLGDVAVSQGHGYGEANDVPRQQAIRRAVRSDLERSGFTLVSDPEMSHDLVITIKEHDEEERIANSDSASNKDVALVVQKAAAEMKATANDGKLIDSYVAVISSPAGKALPEADDVSQRLVNGLYSSDKFSDFVRYAGIPSSVEATIKKDEATTLLAVLPMSQSSSLGRDDIVAIEEILRGVAGEILSPYGYVVLTSDNTIQIIRDNGGDPTKVCEEDCALAVARELKVSLFVTGVVTENRYDRTMFLRLSDAKKGQQIASLELQGNNDELRRQLRNKSRAFFRKAIRR